MKVQNMQSDRGNDIPNQFIISGLGAGTITVRDKENEGEYIAIPSGTMFQSYNSNIVYRDYTGKVYLDETYWDYSVTTGKYRNLFLGEKKKETEAKIKSGEYTLCNLN